MSKLDIRSAIRVSGINAEFNGNPGKVLLVTQAMLDAFPADEDSKFPDVEVGEAVVSYREGEKVKGKVILPGAENDLVAVVRDADRNEHRISIGSMRALVDAVRSDVGDADLSAKGRDALAAIADYSEVVFDKVLENSRMAAPETISSALSFQLEKSRRAELNENGLTPEQMDLYTQARGLRETIGRINPDHEDALAPKETYVSEGLSHEVVADLNIRNQGFSESQRRALVADRRLTEEVFGVMTKTSISDLKADFLDPNAFETIRQQMRPGQVKGKFLQVIKERLDGIFEARMPGYKNQYGIELYTKNGADLLLVKDQAGHYVYGWDTDSRQLEIADENALMIGAADIPTAEEIERLRDIVADLRYENGDEIEFDNFEDGEIFDMSDAFDDADPAFDGVDDEFNGDFDDAPQERPWSY